MSSPKCSTLAEFFGDRTGVLATMHRKEQVIAPLVEDALGIQVTVPTGLNTDEFGTFTRDVERTGDQRTAARMKAEAAMTLTGLSLGLASEGRFGPHPSLPFVASNHELVVLCDRQHGLEILGQAVSPHTNFNHRSVTTVEEAIAFAQAIGAPSHGVVVMSNAQPTSADVIIKGLTDAAQIQDTVQELLKKFGRVHLETDMRAMYNPTRMKVIAQATQDLIQQLQQFCPQCGYPGFSVKERRPGLPCGLCGFPSSFTLAVTHSCQHCQFSEVRYFPDGQETVDPMYCSYCNP